MVTVFGPRANGYQMVVGYGTGAKRDILWCGVGWRCIDPTTKSFKKNYIHSAHDNITTQIILYHIVDIPHKITPMVDQTPD